MSSSVPALISLSRFEVRLCGSGGQGIILAGLVLTEAVGVFDGREVAMVQSYGPEARGGASKAEIIISDSPIDYPLCSEVDLLVALTQEAADTYSWDLNPKAWVLIDEDLVSHPPTSRAIALPFTAQARDELHNVLTANFVVLGAISEIDTIVTRNALQRAMTKSMSPAYWEINKKALELGADLYKKYGLDGPPTPLPEISDEDM